MDLNLEAFSVPIPTCFYSIETGIPFVSCSVCSCNLFDYGKDYFIEKVFRDANVEFEFSICEDCKSKLSEQISLKSMMSMSNYFMNNFDLETRIKIIDNFDNSIVPWLEKCIFKGTPRRNCRDYQMSAHCNKDQLIVSILPFMVSFKASEEMQKTISKETKESFDKFMKEVINPPGSIKDIPIIV
jgi:hypothetical protein